MERETIVEADLTWVDGAFEPNVQVVIGSNGLITQVGYLEIQPTLRLEGSALLPGMINAHSHAFQRGLRGFGEEFPSPGNFWTWREAMYELVKCLGAEEFKNLCRIAFEEMLQQGITTVGEFHYFHHDRGKSGYSFDDLVLEAAAAAGIRIVLLCAYYAHGGIQEPLSGVQARFGSPNVEHFCKHVDALRKRASGLQKIGIAVHSIRGANPEEIVELADYARANNLVLHIHAEEQRQEIEECRDKLKATPVEILLKHNILSENVTLIHCTHTSAENLHAISETGAHVCICPTTGCNLGDGVPDVPSLVKLRAKMCLGTESNTRISMNEQMRLLEYLQRAKLEIRGVCVDEHGRSAHALWNYATTGGAAALGIPGGKIAPNSLADFIAVDTQGLSLLGATRESLLAAFVLGADRSCITHTCVAGKWRNWAN